MIPDLNSDAHNDRIMNEYKTMNERPNLKFYLSPTLHVNPNMSVCTMMEAMFMIAFRRGWIATSKTNHGKAKWNKIQGTLCIPAQEPDKALYYATHVANYLTEQGFLAATSKFNNETHPWDELIDIVKMPELISVYSWAKEYVIGVIDWDDVHHIITSAS
jgi:hypothetical protein